MATPSVNHWLAKIHDQLAQKPDPVPKGFKTCQQLADEIGKSRATVQPWLADGVKAGLIEVRRLRVDANGRLQWVPFYRQLVPKRK